MRLDVLKRLRGISEVFKEDCGRYHRDFQMGSKRSQQVSGGFQRCFRGFDGASVGSWGVRGVLWSYR